MLVHHAYDRIIVMIGIKMFKKIEERNGDGNIRLYVVSVTKTIVKNHE
jgi:hypothetical protein